MIREIIRNDITSDICHLGLELNMHHKFCSYSTHTENQSADIKLSLPANKKITIYWGDGTSTVVTGAVTTTIYSHTYTDVKTYNLTVSGDYNDIMHLYFIGDGSYGGDIKYFPNNLLRVYCWEDNTFSGNVINFSRNLQRCGITGSTSITGIWNDVPEPIESFYLTGNNTLSGDIGENGTKLTALSIKGYNTISDYTSKTWTTNISVFKFIPVSPGGLSSAEIDQLLIDLDNDLDWSGGGTITLTGTNAPRTSASDDAVSNIEAEGGTVICNT